MNATKTNFKGRVGIRCTKYVPINVPRIIPGRMPLTAVQWTLLCETCERILENEVNKIVVVEVASAILCKSGCTMPDAVKSMVINGTEISPPPTPSRPAIKPAKQPNKG